MERRNKPDLASTLAFTLEQLQCLKSLAPTLEGRTKKQQNPYPPLSLPWATWLIARLGASGYQSQRPPGTPTLVHGLRQFQAILIGWKLAQF